MTISPFETFIAPARPRNQLWRLIAGILLIGVVWLAVVIGIMAFLQAQLGVDEFAAARDEIARGATPFGVLVLFLTFGGLLVGAGAAAILLHRRSAMTLIGPVRAFVRDAATVLPISIALYAILTLAWFLIFDAVPNMELRVWIGLLGIGLAGLVLQTLAEEVAFRGYLMQQLAARFDAPVIWMGLPALAFGLMHITPGAGPLNGTLIIVATGVFGLITADLTRRTGSLGAAWGLHLGNNIFAVLIVALDDTLPGLALWLTPYSVSDAGTLSLLLIVDIASLVLIWALLVRILGR